MNTATKVQQNFKQANLELDLNKVLYAPNDEGVDMYMKLTEDLSYEQSLEIGLHKGLKLITTN